jgi:predicted MFS family arabinose efflux permease
MSGRSRRTGQHGPVAFLVGAWRSGSLRLAAAAVAATAAAAAPVFLLGSVAVQVRAEFGVGRTQLGLAVAGLYAASVLTGPLVVARIERMGPRAGMMVTASLGGVALLAIAGLARTFWALTAAMVVAGVGQAFGQPSANGLLARGLRPGRQGLAFGIKQVGIPLPALLAGLALPLVALTVGWRWVFGGAAVLVLLMPLLVPAGAGAGRPALRDARAPESAAESAAESTAAVTRPLRRLALAAMFAAVAVISFGAFLVDTVVTAGISQAAAGGLLVYGSVVSIGVRLLLGWLVDRRALDPLRVMASMMAIGAVGTATLGLAGELWVFVLIVTVVWSFGWSWNPLIDLAAVRLGRAAPAAASGLLVTGFYAGAAVGPFAVGAVADAFGYPAAWLLAAVSLGVAAALSASVVALRDAAGGQDAGATG